MPQKPQRPFVPHRTPKNVRPTITASEFRLYRPFLPGVQREMVESIAPIAVRAGVESQSAIGVPVRPIEDFLDTSAASDEPEELPPVEHFLDPLPPMDHFAPDAGGALSDAWSAASGDAAPTGVNATELSESGWIETDWQHYNWRAAAALGETADHEASSAWATTDWDGTGQRTRDARQTAANALATALDEIAQRIREGELAVPGASAMSDPATVAATLAALLGVRR